MEPVHQYSSSSCRERLLHSLLCSQPKAVEGSCSSIIQTVKKLQILSISLYSSLSLVFLCMTVIHYINFTLHVAQQQFAAAGPHQ